jgi:hypothetical protein
MAIGVVTLLAHIFYQRHWGQGLRLRFEPSNRNLQDVQQSDLSTRDTSYIA